MSSSKEIVVTLGAGRRVDAELGAHVIHTDQPIDNGGADTAPSPFDLFLASLGACAGLFIQSFCARREIPTEDIRVVERPTYGEDGALASVDLEVQLPAAFPEKYRDAVLRAADQCTVKKAISAPLRIAVRRA